MHLWSRLSHMPWRVMHPQEAAYVQSPSPAAASSAISCQAAKCQQLMGSCRHHSSVSQPLLELVLVDAADAVSCCILVRWAMDCLVVWWNV